MIDIRECSPIHLMPEEVRKDERIQAASYALSETIRMLVGMVERAAVMAAIDRMPEEIVDLLAIELRSQYYEQGMDIGKKREIVKHTLLWYYNAGTPSAMQEMIRIIFGDGSRVEEWWQYDGKPYLFKIIVDDQENLLTDEQWEKMEKMIRYVKNARSHLESIQYLRYGRTDLHAGIGESGYTFSVIGGKGGERCGDMA